MRIAVLGTTGMLGSMVFDYLQRQGLAPTPINRPQLDASKCLIDDVVRVLGGYDYVVNCMGVIKQVIRPNSNLDLLLAFGVNGRFPKYLSRLPGVVIQPETDCVFDGTPQGARITGYDERSVLNPMDTYSESKSFGEVHGLKHLRCSLIGPEIKGYHSLLSKMVLSQPEGATIPGYVNHWWNGITTLHWAKICAGIIKNRIELAPMQHIVPADVMTKYGLLKTAAAAFGRQDLKIVPGEALYAVDRRLATIYPEMNLHLWKAAGYNEAPTISEMLNELADYAQIPNPPCR